MRGGIRVARIADTPRWCGALHSPPTSGARVGVTVCRRVSLRKETYIRRAHGRDVKTSRRREVSTLQPSRSVGEGTATAKPIQALWRVRSAASVVNVDRSLAALTARTSPPL